ncbi:hypothetical protein QUF80_14770 [Desulfococcaceae bacterium HSG8]|nr:hypothetical protein [Desulfococcaceae bacterium HSG8]
MKKIVILALVALLAVAFTMPASAMENVFGGYWRTRAYTNQNFTGDDSEMQDWTVVDTRCRLYYTAILNDNLKLVNKFEMDATWGDQGSYGDIGADGVKLEIKNSYGDFNVGPVNAKIGVQGMAIARGFFFDDDFAGAVVSYSDDIVTFPLIWMKAYEGGEGHNRRDVDYYGIAPSFNLGTVTLNPFAVYATSDNARDWENSNDYYDTEVNVSNFDDVDLYYAGVNLDADLGMGSVWLTGIYQGGEVELKDTENTSDFKAYLGAAGVAVNLGPVEVHGQGFYASGQPADDENEEDITGFWVPKGQSYYWSEIMGYGTFDNGVSKNSPADQIGNIMAGNIGVTFKPMPDLSISLDGWYAKLAEDSYVYNGKAYGAGGLAKLANSDKDEDNELYDDILDKGKKESELGIEANLTITYQLVKGLSVDVVGAYLFAGDLTTCSVKNEENPYEVGTRLSLSF